MPATVAIDINLIDAATHTWDLARATGQAEELPGRLAAMILRITRGFVTDEMRPAVGYDPEVVIGDDASATSQLVAFLGRTP